MISEKKILLRNCDFTDQNQIEFAIMRGAYSTCKKALNDKPEKIVQAVKNSNLRGRGGAGFFTGKKWEFIAKDSLKPAYLIVNADESEIGVFKDRYLLEKDPHLIIEGVILTAYAIGAEWCCIYLRGEYTLANQILTQAISDCYRQGYLGKNIFGTKINLDLVIHRSAGAYVCGEESALLNAIEGKRACPRLKPPFPAVAGLYNCPTIINNVETLANIPRIVEYGADAYKKMGVKNSYGTKLVSVSGSIINAGVYEIEFGLPILEFIENICGGIKNGRKLKAVFTGGASVNILKADELNGISFDYESLANAGSALGCAGLIVLDDSCNMLDVALNLARFYKHESCGQCTPCREGTSWLYKIIRRLKEKGGTQEDYQLVLSLCEQIAGHTVCAFGDTMILPIKSIFEKFKDEILNQILNSKSLDKEA